MSPRVEAALRRAGLLHAGRRRLLVAAFVAVSFALAFPPLDQPLRAAIAPMPTAVPASVARIWFLPGIGGTPGTTADALCGMVDGGAAGEIVYFAWNTYNPSPRNLWSYEENHARARRLADDITAFARANPDATIDIVAHSGGAGVALFAIEYLTDDVRLRNVLLCHPAISPTYPLDATLRHLTGDLVLFRSDYDTLLLGVGTTLFGTVDRRFTESAGKVGFDLAAAAADAGLREKVVQIAWDPQRDGALGHLGGHHGMLIYDWNRTRVGPWLRLDRRSAAASID